MNENGHKHSRTDALLTVCDMVPTMMGIVEVSKEGNDICHVHGNIAAANYFGTSSKNLDNQSLTEIGVPESFVQLWLQKLSYCLMNDQTISFEYEFDGVPGQVPPLPKRWSKATLWCLPVRDTEGQPRFVYLVEDVTSYRLAEAALQESESYLRLAMEGADIGTFVANFKTGMIQLSPHARRHLGLAEAQEWLPVEEMDQLVYEEDRPIFQEAVSKAQSEHSPLDLEYRVRFPDGSLHWGRTKAQFHFDVVTGEPQTMIGVCFDIDERKRHEAENAAAVDRQNRVIQALQRSLLSVGSEGATFQVSKLGGIITLRTQGNYGSWQIALLYEPVLGEARIGGDFYDIFAIDEERIAFVVGDVAGKGLGAAESVAEIKFGLRSVLRGISANPAFALSFVNDRQMEAQNLDGRSRELLFAVTIVIADNASGTLQIARAGAEAPLICRVLPDSILLRPISDIADLPVGAMPETIYKTVVESLAEQETLLLYTDGLTETNHTDKESGSEILQQAILSILTQEPNLGADCATLCRRIVDTVYPPKTKPIRRDDICLLVARRA